MIADAQGASGELVDMTFHTGKKYRCLIPSEIIEEETAEYDISNKNATHFLAPLQGTCIYRVRVCVCGWQRRHADDRKQVEGWWTYEVCFGKYVRQYHLEKEKITAEYYLGRTIGAQGVEANGSCTPPMHAH